VFFGKIFRMVFDDRMPLEKLQIVFKKNNPGLLLKI